MLASLHNVWILGHDNKAVTFSPTQSVDALVNTPFVTGRITWTTPLSRIGITQSTHSRFHVPLAPAYGRFVPCPPTDALCCAPRTKQRAVPLAPDALNAVISHKPHFHASPPGNRIA